MLAEIRTDNDCYNTDANLEIDTYDQYWDKESIQQLKEEHNIFFMSKSDAVLPVQIIMDKNNKPRLFRIGVEDDGTLFFGNNIEVNAHVRWIDSLIKDLQTAKKFIEKYKQV